MRTSTVVFTLSTVAQVAVAAFFAVWPLHAVGIPLVPAAAWATYTLADSVLDVCVATSSNVFFVFCVLRYAAAASTRRGTSFRDAGGGAHTRALKALSAGAAIFQLLLLAKAVVVAILGADGLMPGKRRSGLAAIYGAIVAALLTSFAQAPAAKAIVRRWKRAAAAAARAAARAAAPAESDGDGALTAPLLGDRPTEKAKEDEEDGAGVDPETRRATIGALLRLSGPDVPILLAAFSAGAAAALGQALIPYYSGRIIDYASIDPNPAAFRVTTIKLLGVAAACAVATGIRGGLFSVSMTRLNVRLRTNLFASLMRQDAAFFDSVKTGEITSRLAADTSTVADQISLNLNVMLRSATQAAMVLAFMFTASWRLTVVTFVAVPLVLAVVKVYGSYYRQLSKKVQAELAAANAVAEEALGTMSTVKAHAAEGSTQAAYSAKLAGFYSLQRSESLAYALYMSTSTFLSAAVVAGVLFYGGTLVLEHCMSAGALVSFMLYQQSLSGAFQQLGDVFSALAAAVGAADKVIELMHREPKVPPAGPDTLMTLSGRIELRGVVFSYPSRPAAPVLRGLSLSVDPGEVVALVGPSGGGKSSVVRLIERFYLPAAGSVLIDGRDVGAYDPGWLRRRVALVSQEPVLYARSIRRNIVFGLEEEDGVPEAERPTDADVEAAARLANAYDFIMALPQGFDTEISGSTALSGGQKQRLAIARALVRRPAVLLLDEATSALDAESECVVQEALDRTMAGRTVLVIAHRLSTVRGASRIVVVQGGVVAEEGTHEELLERGGAYAALVRRQLAIAEGEGGGSEKVSVRRTSSYIAMTK